MIPGEVVNALLSLGAVLLGGVSFVVIIAVASMRDVS